MRAPNDEAGETRRFDEGDRHYKMPAFICDAFIFAAQEIHLKCPSCRLFCGYMH